MSEFMETLKPRRLGAEILARLARERRDGELTWIHGGQQRKILFKGGRPEVVVDRDGRESAERQHVVVLVRAFATAAAGQCIFELLSRELAPALGIDTLGETLVALALTLRADQLEAIWAARRAEIVEGTPSFEKFARAVVDVGGMAVSSPPSGATVGSLVAGKSEEEQRAWAALISLGAVRTRRASTEVASEGRPSGQPPDFDPPAAKGDTVPNAEPFPRSVTASGIHTPAPGPMESGPQRVVSLPEDPEARRVALEIERMYRSLADLDLYTLLGIEKTASSEEIRNAYFQVAKRWHSDRFKSHNIGDEFERKAEEIFRRIGEAQEVLSDEEKRKSYDFVQDRKDKGLPTDVSVILEAEGLFRKAQSLVRRGQAAQAEPMLRQAIEMNKGEADFWAYFGFSVYAAKGSEGLAEARAALKKALEMNEKLDVAHEFLGRIARVEGNTSEARRELGQAVEMNPKNVEAQRELRLLNLRADKDGAKGKGLGGLIGNLLKK